MAAQKQPPRPARRRHAEAEIIIDEEEKPPARFDAPAALATPQEDVEHRRRLLSRALEEVGVLCVMECRKKRSGK